MKVIIFSHESDLDGIFSGAIGLIRYPQADTIFLGYGVENFTKMANIIYSATYSYKEKGIFVISDLGLNDNVINICKDIFSKAKKNGWRIIWVDHHTWSQEAIEAMKPFTDIVIDSFGGKCAADLMYETFVPGHSLEQNLRAWLIQWIFLQRIKYLTQLRNLSVIIIIFLIPMTDLQILHISRPMECYGILKCRMNTMSMYHYAKTQKNRYFLQC